jgi:hypothetical protein
MPPASRLFRRLLSNISFKKLKKDFDPHPASLLPSNNVFCELASGAFDAPRCSNEDTKETTVTYVQHVYQVYLSGCHP